MISTYPVDPRLERGNVTALGLESEAVTEPADDYKIGPGLAELHTLVLVYRVNGTPSGTI